MKKTAFLMALSISFVFPHSAKMVEVISENTIKVIENGAEKKLHLTGINLFAKANNNTESNTTISMEKREELKKEALSYLKNALPNDSTITYTTVAEDKFGIRSAWVDNNDGLNYKIIKDGFALIDLDDSTLPTGFKRRMLIAQNYAKEKGNGLWGKHKEMNALDNKDIASCGCGFTQKRDVAQDTLKDLKNRL
jgi:endonuclease YncB( thermonuclease family)